MLADLLRIAWRLLNVAEASLAEVGYCVQIALRLGYVDDATYEAVDRRVRKDLDCWRFANDLKRALYGLLEGSLSARKDLDFASQLRDAASSGPANISEAFACYRHKESGRYARIAKSSLTETHKHLADGVDRGHWTAERIAGE